MDQINKISTETCEGGKGQTHLQEVGLLRGDVVEGDVGSVRLLAHKHGMSVAEGATPHILPTQTHIETCTHTHETLRIERCTTIGTHSGNTSPLVL